MVESATSSTRGQRLSVWIRRIGVCAALVTFLVIIVNWIRPPDLTSAVNRAGGAISWQERPSFTQRLGNWVFGEVTGGIGVNLNDTKVDDEWLRRYKRSLRAQYGEVELALGGTNVTDEGLSHLRDVENLTFLWLSNTEITGRGLDYLVRLPRLNGVVIHGTRITDDDLKKIAAFPSLELVGLDSSQFTQTGADHLRGCAQLDRLTIRNADEESVARLQGFTQLSFLYLDGEDVTDRSVPVLSQLTGLQGLTLLDSQLSKEGLDSLQKSIPACSISPLTSEELEASAFE